jgi:TolB-like protein/DNA-binding winged helix-turn-helix (wHTH) protein/Flp pilus assembly protein TadD
MKNSNQPEKKLRFGDFEADLRTGDVRKQGHRIRLQEKPFQILALLLERAGDVVTREELRQRLWPADTFVDFDANLNTSLNRLRQALGDTGNEQVFIKTIPRQGYRFIAPVVPIEERDEPLASHPGSSTPAAPSTHIAAPLPNPNGVAAAAPVAQESSAGATAKGSWQSGFWRRARYVFAMAILVAMAVGSLAYIRSFWPLALAGRSPGRETILVTPFENLSGDAGQDYLSDGLTDEMITRLGQAAPGHMSVIARSSAMQYKGAHKTVEQIAREQHVDYILEGSFRRQGDQVRITARLFDACGHGSLWTEAYERNASDLLAIQREVADKIARSLSNEISVPAARPPAEARPVKPESYDAYLKGLYELNMRTPDDLERSIEFFRTATEKDPQFAPAYAALGFSYNVAAGWTFMSPQEAYPKARAAAQKALAIDDSLADSHLAYGEVLHEYDWDWSGAEKEYQRALELNPSSAVGHKLYAEYLTHAGRYQEALGEIRKAQELDPVSLVTNSFVCFVYMHGREYDKAIKECEKVVELQPRFMPAHAWLADACVFSGRYEQAAVEFKKALELSSSANYFLTSLAMTYGLEGKKDDARKLLGELKLRATQTYVSPFGLADVYIGLDDREQALAELDQALQEHSADLVFLASAPEFDSLHNDPRFKAMIARIGFPDTALIVPTAASR